MSLMYQVLNFVTLCHFLLHKSTILLSFAMSFYCRFQEPIFIVVVAIIKRGKYRFFRHHQLQLQVSRAIFFVIVPIVKRGTHKSFRRH